MALTEETDEEDEEDEDEPLSIVETGTHKELLQKTGLYRQLVSKQLSGSGLKNFKESLSYN